jgi:hypothetical protein
MRRTISGKTKTSGNLEPTTQTFNITFFNVTTNMIGVNATKGNGDKRILVCKTSPFDDYNDLPINGTTYNANQIYGLGDQILGGGYVVYNGTSTSIVVMGLMSQTTYYFKYFEYNGSGVNTLYLFSNGINNPSNQITL